MIYASVNEIGERACDLVVARKKCTTRRERPVKPGSIRAVQPGRGKKAVGYVRILSCERHKDWYRWISKSKHLDEALQREAEDEGFKTWDGLLSWFEEHNIDINDTYRLTFRFIPKSDIENVRAMFKPWKHETDRIIFKGNEKAFDAWCRLWYKAVPRCKDFSCCHELMSCGIYLACGDCSIHRTMVSGAAYDICFDVGCVDCDKHYDCKKAKEGRV